MTARICASVVCLLLAATVPSAAQTSTEDGIRAVLRGDYSAAARILQPLATAPSDPDPVAQYFLAILHATGKGVRQDVARACRLFLEAGQAEHPFSPQSAALGAAMQRDIGPLCPPVERRPSGAPRNTSSTSPRDAGAKASTADGVVALSRGDLTQGVEILKPIAEDWRSADAAAQFFMAGLYESGLDVASDPLRACALYMRAASAMENPFGSQAMHLLIPLATRSPEFNEECQVLGNVGFEHGFQPALFDLGPGHFVQWTLAAATVTFDGGTRRHQLGLQMPGARFLPLQHTRLSTGPSGADTRHFAQLFMWSPLKPSEWQLWWHIYEILGDNLVRIDGPSEIVTVRGEQPPSNGFDVREYTALHVDAEGWAQWEVLKGLHARAERIESETERREVRDQARAREKAMKSVDWDRRTEVSRPPSFAYTDANGCGLARLYAWTADRTEVIILSVRLEQLDAAPYSATYDLARDIGALQAEVRLYGRAQGDFRFCSDVRMIDPSNVFDTWQAVAGTITVELAAPGVRARQPSLRRATVTLRDLVLRNAAGTTVRATGPVRLTAIVGGFGA